MMRPARVLVLLMCVCGGAAAQEQTITPDTPVDTGTLHTWLHSGDPRLIAWSADFARRNHDAQIVSEIPEVLEHWSTPLVPGAYPEGSQRRRAELALLDTVIQEKVTVPFLVIRGIEHEFAAQALILIKDVPPRTAESTLRYWAFGKDSHISDRRARAVAMLMAVKPDASFVYEISSGSEQHLTVHIVAPGEGAGSGFGGSCGDSMPVIPDSRWPLIYDYRLVEEDQTSVGANALPIAAIGSHSIGAVRFDVNGGSGDCATQRSEAEFRHELIAYSLGMKPNEMAWQAEESRSIVWSTKSAYLQELGTLVEAQRAKMLESFEQLRERGLLDGNGAGVPAPRLVLSVECHINPCPLK